MQQFPQYGSRNYHSTEGKSLAYHRNVVIGLSIPSFIFWAVCIGVPAALCFSSEYITTHFNGFLLVVANSTYIVCTFHILSLITSDDFPTHGGLKSLRSLMTLFLAVTVIGIAIFLSSTIHYATFGDSYLSTWKGNSTAFGCSFTCFWNCFLFIWFFLYYRKCCTVLAQAENFGNSPSALESLGHHSTANPHPMTSNEVTQIQMLTESQQHQLQQQQQNVIVLPNDGQQGNYYSNRNTGSETSAPPLSYVYVPQNRET